MGGSLKDLVKKINDVGDKTKKIADIVYLFGLVFFMTSQACGGARVVFVDFVRIFLLIGSAILFVAGFYRFFFTLFKNWKLGLLSFAIVVFGFIYSSFVADATEFPIIALAIVGGIGVCADYILYAGIASNFFMILNNVFMVVFDRSDMTNSVLGYNDFFYLGDDVFTFPIMNNCSSTDFASHYFWMLAAYLWIRGKKVTWGEVFAVGTFDFLIYSFTGSNTTLIGITFIWLFMIGLKLWTIINRNKLNTDVKKSLSDKLLIGINSIVMFCARYSFVFFAIFSIVVTILFYASNPLFYRLNGLLHLRVGLGHRAYEEFGVHMFAPKIPIYGAYSSADGYYNFLDCSYIVLLIQNGILPLIFYIASMTAIQIRQKKYSFGIVLLAVCALVCVEEHHLTEIPSNMFILLLFADMGIDKKLAVKKELTKKEMKTSNIYNYASCALCAFFAIVSVLVNYPRFEAKKEMDRLDNKAEMIYLSVQNNLDNAKNSGIWQQQLINTASVQYGELMSEPDDFTRVTGSSWNKMTKDPKAHSYYQLYYDVKSSGLDNEVTGLLFDDEVKNLIGDGSIILEYDAVNGKVYSVWFSEYQGCTRIEGVGSRDSSRQERLRWDVPNIGYYAGGKNA